MHQSQQTQFYLKQIRDMLANQPNQSTQSPSQLQPNAMIQQSFKLLQNKSQLKNDPSLTYSKIKEASQLLSQTNPMLKSYVKQKITSQFYQTKNQPGDSQQYLIEMKDKLQKKRIVEKEQQQYRMNQMIESTHRYIRNQKVRSVPLPQIESLIKDQPYFNYQKEDYAKKSTKIKIPTTSISKKLFSNSTSQRNQTSFILSNKKSSEMEEIYQFDDEEEDESKFNKNIKQDKSKSLRAILINNPKFLMCFQGFLQKQIRIASINTSSIHQNLQLHRTPRSSKTQKPKYIYKVRAQKFDEGKIMKKDRRMSSITQKYKTKGFLIQPQQLDSNAQKCKKIVNKKIGESNKYHLKQCVLTSNYLYYADQQNEEEDVDIRKMKSLQIQFLPVAVNKMKKQEGNVFQKKEEEVDIVAVKGKKRNFYFQKSYAQGGQLYDQLNNLLCIKFHNMNCLLGMRIHPNMLKFIKGQHQTLDLSQQYINAYELYPNREYRTTGLSFIMALFPHRTSTRQIKLQNSKLNPNQLNTVLVSAQTYFDTITQIEAAKNKLSKQNLGNIFKLIKKCPSKYLMKLDLTNCSIDDQCFNANILNFNKIFSKISQLILKGNLITSKTLQSLTNCLASKVCEITFIDVSNCPISDLISLANMIKASHKLRTLQAQNCSFILNQSESFKYLLQCCRVSHLASLKIGKNEALKSFQTLDRYWTLEKPKQIELDISSQLKNTIVSDYIKAEVVG